MKEPSDEALIVAYRKGDSTAFEEIVRRHGDRLLGYLNRMSRNREQAEDLFQETFQRVHDKAETFDGRGKFKSWLFTIATRVALDQIRKNNREPKMISLQQSQDCRNEGCYETDAIGVIEKSPDPSQSAEHAEQKARVRQAIAKLPQKQRATLVLSYYQGHSYREIAQISGCSLGTVKTHMFRALRTLARQLPDVPGAAE